MPDNEIRLPFVTVQAAIRQLPTMTVAELRALIPDLHDSIVAMDKAIPGRKRPKRQPLEAIEGTRRRRTKPRDKLAAVKGGDDG